MQTFALYYVAVFLFFYSQHKAQNKYENRKSYLHKLCQNFFFSLVFAIAQEAVCVNIVFVAIQWNFNKILSSGIWWDREGDLSGGSSQVQWPYSLCSMRTNPGIPNIFLYRSKWTSAW